jgi:hypothetical protein
LFKSKNFNLKLYLSFASVGGIFLVLVVGLCLSFMVALFEFFWRAKQMTNTKVAFLLNQLIKYNIYMLEDPAFRTEGRLFSDTIESKIRLNLKET